MPKRGARHVRDPGLAKCQKSHFRSVKIGLSNGKRWLSLRKRLNLKTDEDLVVYLLNLADSVTRQEEKVEQIETCIEKNSEDAKKNESLEEETLRRSPRKQNFPSEETVPENAAPISKAGASNDTRAASRTKQRKNKTKHHKEKRKKRKHGKEEETKVENPSQVPAIVENWKITEEKTRELENLEAVPREITKKDLPLFQDLTASAAVNGIEPEVSDKADFQGAQGLISEAELEKIERNQPIVMLQTLSDSCKENLQSSKKKDEKKTKKRKKRPKDEGPEEEEEEADSEHKHHRKRHKHEPKKQHHDVRKAPENGVVQEKEPLGGEALTLENNPNDLQLSEPQRLAIKIKLCLNCNSPHLQDLCPLVSPQLEIRDSTSLQDWMKKHQDNEEIRKFAFPEDPMSEGYGKPGEEVSESDDEANSGEQFKVNKIKVEREEDTLEVDPERPIFARDSLPECFELRMTNTKHGLGVYTKQPVPMYAKFGPLVGRPVKEMDIPDDFSMRHIWEVQNGGSTSYVSTTNPLNSNWIRYVRPCCKKENRSASMMTSQGQLYLITTQSLAIGMELTYWADSQSSAWNKKNKMDKTNCGGCNLNFLHSIYYRLHCWIFHDTNYSLTIRKYHCKVCGAAVLGKDNIVKHAAELHAGRGAYQCQYCKKFFLRLNYLEMHRTYGCSQNPQRSRPLCDFCGRKFCQPQKLKVHIKRMHSDMAEVLREFQCKSCLKLLGSRAALQRHMKEVHHKDVVGAATCDRCGKMFQNKSNLKIHMLTHSGVKPFKCRENTCKAAFTTKQCLQFHYKKVHGLTEAMMPKIERSVAYTFDAYSGGLVEDLGRGKSPKFGQNGSQDYRDDPNTLCVDDPDPQSPAMETVNSETQQLPSVVVNAMEMKSNSDLRTPPSSPEQVSISIDSNLEAVREDVDIYGTLRLQSKGSKKWLGEFNPPAVPEQLNSTTCDIYEFEDDRKEQMDKNVTSQILSSNSLIDETKLGMSVYRRPESTSASLLVEAALDAAERAIGAVASLKDGEREAHIYSISAQLQSPIPARSSPEAHLESYIQQQQEELMSPTGHENNPEGRHSPHLHLDYQLHRPMDYIGNRSHIEQFLHHEDIPRVVSPNAYVQVQQDDLTSPSATPTSRYQDLHHHHHHHHHQVSSDNLSSDEGDSVAQNLSLSVKEKSLQLDLSTTYKYDALDSEFGRERGAFEPLVLSNGELQGLDMSARGYHHPGFPAQVQSARYHHHHLYEISERESVDLSRTGAYSLGSASSPPYPHGGDVLRVVSLDLTPTCRPTHSSVDLSLSRPHLLQHPPPPPRILTSPLPGAASSPHITVQDNLENRILSSSPPPLPAYNPASYPVSPTPHHIPRSGYHHYSGYY